jgi:hypothetical protein
LALSFLSAISIGCAATAAIGCGFHPALEVQLESMYPGSFTVAVALRKGADNGFIDSAILDAPRNVSSLYLKTMPRLQAFGKFLAASPSVAELPASFTVGYVESSLWTRFSQSDGKVRVDVHTDGPAEGEAVLLTGEPVLMEMLAGRLSIDRALADGLILIEGNEGEKMAIHHVLNTTSMATRISRRQISN